MAIAFADAFPYLLLWVALAFAMFPGRGVVGSAFIALSLAAAVVVGIVAWAGLAVLVLFAGSCMAAVRRELPTVLRARPWRGARS